MAQVAREATCTAPVNIAVVKYWGKRDVGLNLPCNSSLSVTLSQDHLQSKTTARAAPQFTRDRLWLNGVEEEMENKRLLVCLRSVRARAEQQAKAKGQPRPAHVDWKIHVCSWNNFPTAAGLASSASGYACLVVTLAKLFELEDSLEDLSTIARQGSGSACRSLFGGFVAWNMGTAADGFDSRAEQIEDEHYWPEMECLVLVVSDHKKAVSSTAGMQTSMATSELLRHRAAAIVPERMRQMTMAIRQRDFGTFATLTMQDSNQFHAVCLDTYPPVFYLNDVSRTIIGLVSRLNALHGTPLVAYTFDAGPNAVLYLLKENVARVLEIILRYFPPTNDSTYFTDPYGVFAATAPSPREVVEQREAPLLAAVPIAPQPGALKYILHSRVGDGPRHLQDATASLLDAEGLPLTMTAT